jgi:hypothetical protein
LPVLLSNALTIPVIFWNNEIPFKYENRHDYTVSARKSIQIKIKPALAGFFRQKRSALADYCSTTRGNRHLARENYAAGRDED